MQHERRATTLSDLPPADDLESAGRSAATAPVEHEQPQASHQYECVIDLGSDNTHAKVIEMVGEGRRVLELGPATGYMSAALRQRGCTVTGVELDASMAAQAARFCERVIVGDLDTLDLADELGEDRFDVIVAADVLEHLRDPLRALRTLSAFLRPEGYFVVSLPNVAHASVRLALLEGKFTYRRLGLLDSTHLRFFTRESMEAMFDEVGLAVVEMHRQELDVEASEVAFDTSAVPDELMDALRRDVDARTYQFIFKALPLGRPGLSRFQELMRSMARERADLQNALAARESENAQLREALTAITVREGEIRMALIDAHDLALRRDEELRQLTHTGDRLEQAEEQLAELWKAHAEAKEIIAIRDGEIAQLRVRLERIAQSLPVRMWHSISRLPPLRWLRARRVAGYNAALPGNED